MQRLRNFFFYFSPLIGVVLGWFVGRYSNKFVELLEILFGVGAGILVSISMIVLSVRARFKADPGLTNVQLRRRKSEETPPQQS